MTIESAKEFVHRLSMDQGLFPSYLMLIPSGGCRNCNSNRCQCDRQNSQSIAPASASASPATPLSMGGGSSPYSLGFPSNFSSSTSPSQQMRNTIYPLNSPSYATIPQFTGVPTFSMFPQSHQSHSPTLNPVMTAQVQQFQRRQEQLMQSTHRRMQQEAELHRRNTDTENLLGTLHQPSVVVDPYHRASLPVNFESSIHHDPTSRPTDHHINLQQPSYRETRPQEQAQTPTYTYNPDITHTLGHIPYATSLSTQLFRPPSVTEMDIRRQSVQPIIQPSRDIHQERLKQNSYVTVKETSQISNSSRSSLPLESADSDTSPYDEPTHIPLDNKPMETPPSQQPQQQNLDLLKSKSLVDDETVPESFPNLDRIFENWDAADNEWLYSLQTECARPGAVCECGDSCCCPGCFTHTNNPGDRGVYNTMLNKMGAILETSTEKTDEGGSGQPCHSNAGWVERSPDAKL